VRQRLGGLVSVLSALVVLASCGGSSGGGPNNPTPTPTSITVVSSSTTMSLGQVETFSANFAMSNSTTQIVTGGTWGSDAPSVATVNPTTGLVTAVGRGEATIFVDAQGLRGSKRITVNVTYTGTWTGSYAFTGCTHTGDLALIDFCGIFTIGALDPVSFTLTQTGNTVTGRTSLDIFVSAPFTATVAGNGGLTFTAVYSDATVTISQAWQINIGQSGQMTGTVVQTWTGAGVNGNAVVSGTIQNVTKTPGTGVQNFPSRSGSIVGRLAALLKRR
jgi:hypothetical protein